MDGKEIINFSDLEKFFKHSFFIPISNFTGKSLMKIFKINWLNALYAKSYSDNPKMFINNIIKELNIKLHVKSHDDSWKECFESKILISNHPLGILDGLILLKISIEHSNNILIVSNFFLNKVQPLCQFMCPVDPFENLGFQDNMRSLRHIKRFLNNNGTLLIFPSGQVSELESGLWGKPIDRQWTKTVTKLIKNAKVPVYPVYIDSKNSYFFYFFSAVNKIFRTLLLPSELASSFGKSIRISIGKKITIESQNKHIELEEYSKYLTNQIYSLQPKNSFE